VTKQQTNSLANSACMNGKLTQIILIH